MRQQQTTFDRYSGCQSFLQEGCLFLSLCSIAEDMSDKNIDILDALRIAKQKHWIDSDNNFTLIGQTEFLKLYTGKEWSREVLSKLPSAIPAEMYTVEKWVRGKYTHFKRRYVDTLSNSQTVQKGMLQEYYCYIYSKR